MTVRVAIDARVEFGRAGGVQQGIVALARALGAAGPTGTSDTFVTLARMDEWLTRALPAGAAIAPVGPGRLHAARRALRGSRAGRRVLAAGVALQRRRGPSGSTGCFEALGVDVVHFPTQRAELTDVPFVYQPWDLQHRHLPELFAPAEYRRRETHYRAFCSAAAAVVVPTAYVRDDVVAAYDLDPARVVVISPWAPSCAFGGTSHPVAEREPYLLYPAQAWRHKNHRRLVEAIAALRDEGLEVRVVCPGATGDDAQAVARCAEALGVGRLVELPGYVDDSTVADLYAGARGVVFPSLFEGWGFPVVEAMEAGLPVACASGAYLDAAAGDAALRFDPLDTEDIARAMRMIWCDEERRLDLVRRGAVHAAAFRWSDIGRAYREVHLAAARREAPVDAVGHAEVRA